MIGSFKVLSSTSDLWSSSNRKSYEVIK